MTVIPGKRFEKTVRKLPIKIKEVLKNKLGIFMNNPFNPLLENHKLKGSLRKYRSINITGDYRLIYEEYGEEIRLIDIDTHSQLYK